MNNNNDYRGLLRFLYIWLLCIAITLGCGSHHFKKNNYLNREDLKNVDSIAVLPFYNQSKSVNAGVIMANMIIVELVRCGRFRVIKYGDVRNFFLRRRLTSVPTINIETLRDLRREFKVDAVIIGTVIRYENGDRTRDINRKERSFTPSIAISSTILDTRSGKILGKGEFMETGSAEGYLLTNKQRLDTFALTQKLAQKLIAAINIDGA